MVPPKAQKGGHHVFPPPKSSQNTIFFESEFGFTPKNSGLNPWSFQFWGYPRLGPRARLTHSKTGGWIRHCLDDVIGVV